MTAWRVHCDIRSIRIALVADGNVVLEVAPETFDSVPEAEAAAEAANEALSAD